MNKENVTKGRVYEYKNEIREDDPVNGRTLATISDRLNDSEREANAELIAEAFNVLSETGFTPAELAKRIKKLRGVMESVADKLTKQAYAQTKSVRGTALKSDLLVEVRLLNTTLTDTK